MLSRRRLGFESLEGRQLCAGDVTAALVGDELKITGDPAANFVDIQLRKINGEFTFVVVGKAFDGQFDANHDPVAGGPATTINGLAKPYRAVLAAESKITVTTGDGNDAVVIGGTGLAMNLTGLKVATGTGSDYLSIKGVGISTTTTTKLQMTKAGGTSAANEAGDDKVVLANFEAKTSGVGIVTGGGNDNVSVTDISANGAGTSFGINLGDGDDVLAIKHIELNGLNLDGGVGNDKFDIRVATFNKATINAGDGDDAVTLNYNRYFNNFAFNGGLGNDRLDITTVEFQKNFTYTGGDGNDVMKTFHARFLTNLSYNGDRGNDRFVLKKARLKAVVLNGGDGKDLASIDTATGENVTFNGGNGSDSFSIHYAEIQSVSALMGTSAETDSVIVELFRAQNLTVDLGAGNNDLLNYINNVDIKQKATLNGGAGTGDRFIRGPRVLPGAQSFTGFEGFA